MDKTIQRLVRPNILNLAPYTCARNEYTGEARAWLDANENSLIDGLNRYPDPYNWKSRSDFRNCAAYPPTIYFSAWAAMSALTFAIVCSAAPARIMWWLSTLLTACTRCVPT